MPYGRHPILEDMLGTGLGGREEEAIRRAAKSIDRKDVRGFQRVFASETGIREDLKPHVAKAAITDLLNEPEFRKSVSRALDVAGSVTFKQAISGSPIHLRGAVQLFSGASPIARMLKTAAVMYMEEESKVGNIPVLPPHSPSPVYLERSRTGLRICLGRPDSETALRFGLARAALS